MCIFYVKLVETEMRTSALCVSTNYFDPLERTHVMDGEVTGKFITSCVTNHVYGCRLVVTNVTSVDQTVEVLAPNWYHSRGKKNKTGCLFCLLILSFLGTHNTQVDLPPLQRHRILFPNLVAPITGDNFTVHYI